DPGRRPGSMGPRPRASSAARGRSVALAREARLRAWPRRGAVHGQRAPLLRAPDVDRGPRVRLRVPRAGPAADGELSLQRLGSKKLLRKRALSGSRSPDSTVTRWFSRSLRTRSKTEPHAPVFGSDAANTSRATRACTIAPAHIGQGSS